jgi:hypothetical protein
MTSLQEEQVMSRRKFAIVLLLWLAAIMLSSTGLGAMLGFLLGVAVSMYGAALGVVIQAVASAIGLPLSWSATGEAILWLTVAVLGFAALLCIGRGGHRWVEGNEQGALAAWAGAVSIIAAPYCAWLSVQALQAAWP